MGKPYEYHTHETARVVTQTADIDVAMVPLIQWMNCLHGVTTYACCQGEERINSDQSVWFNGYVAFECSDMRSLRKILEILERKREPGKIPLAPLASITVGIKHYTAEDSTGMPGPGLSYQMQFSSKGNLDELIERLQ